LEIEQVNLWWSSLIVLGSSAASIVALLLVRRFSPHGGHFGDTNRAVGVFTILATSFSVLFAFVVFFAFGSYDRSTTSAEVEAQATTQQFETAQLFSEEDAGLLSSQLRCYARSVVYQEWPAMEQGKVLRSNEWDIDLLLSIAEVRPTTINEQAAFEKWLDLRSDRERARDERLLGEEGVIPPPLWFVILITGGIVWAFAFLFADSGEGAVVQSILIGSVTAMLVAGLLLIVFLDRPYSPGPGGLRPTAMEQSLDQMESLSKSTTIEMPTLCDEKGKAIP
jgi:hypothetical protein